MNKILPNVELSKKEYGDLLFSRGIRGGEAKLIIDGSYIIKVFYKNFGYKSYSNACDEIEKIRENKFKKLEILFSFDDSLIGEIKPVNTYTCEGKFVAYRMPYLLYPLVSDECFSKEERLFYLTKMKDILLRFHDAGIVYGDIRGNNFFVNPEKKIVIPGDLDNMQVGDCPIDIINGFVQEFVDNYGSVDDKLDSYMHNLYTLEIFMECDVFGYREVLDRILMNDIPDSLNKNKVKRLVRIDSSYDGSYLIDDLNKFR